MCAMQGAAQGSRVEKAGLTSHICHENYDETVIPLCGRREGRNFGGSGVYSCSASRHAKTVQPLVCGVAR
jgi:hypothetical protein